MSDAHKSECRGGARHCANQTINDLDYATGTRPGKAFSTLLAQFALRGHAVHPLADGGYLVSKYGMTHHAPDLAGLQAFAERVGVTR
ncbi:MAG: hypothetical protein HXX19_07685 [Rhodoferax sp.]|nr:hypothetical protein [Rhodoferax sp.]